MLETLLSETRDVVRRAERASGRTIVLEASRSNFHSWVAFDNKPEITLRFDPDAASVDYTIAEAAMRLCRYYSCPRSRRHIVTPTAEGRAVAYSEMADETMNWPASLRLAAIEHFPALYDGLLTHLASQPGEFWINKRLYDEYPGLRSALSVGVSNSLSQGYSCLSSKVGKTTPFSVFVGSNAMNAAFSFFMSELLRKPDLFLPYVGTPFEILGYELCQINPRDRGWGGDVVATDRWARELGVRWWYGWGMGGTRESNRRQ